MTSDILVTVLGSTIDMSSVLKQNITLPISMVETIVDPWFGSVSKQNKMSRISIVELNTNAIFRNYGAE